MKKTIVLILVIGLTTGAMAQTAEKKEDMKHLRTDIREKRKDNKRVAKDVGHMKLKDAKADHREVVADRKAIRHRARHLKRKGVKHPVVRAKHQIHAQAEAKKYKD